MGSYWDEYDLSMDEPWWSYEDDYLGRDPDFDSLYNYEPYEAGYTSPMQEPNAWMTVAGGGAEPYNLELMNLMPQSYGFEDEETWQGYEPPQETWQGYEPSPQESYAGSMMQIDDYGFGPMPEMAYQETPQFVDDYDFGPLQGPGPMAGGGGYEEAYYYPPDPYGRAQAMQAPAAMPGPGDRPAPARATPERGGAPAQGGQKGRGFGISDAIQAAIGLGGAGMMLGGLSQKSRQVQPPPPIQAPTAARSEPPRLSPQEQRAAAQIETSRQAAAGAPAQPLQETLSARGYAGEEAIREKANQELLAHLMQEAETASPRTVRALEDQRTTLHDRLRQELGPGYFTSTAGQNALKTFEEYAQGVLDQERERRLASRNALALSRSQFARTLELDPAMMAQAELGALSGIGAQQSEQALRAGLANSGWGMQADMANQAQDAANKRALLTTGGQMTGVALSPWIYEALRRGAQR